MTLVTMASARRYNRWMYNTIAPFIGRRILEVGSGIGNMTAELFARQFDRLLLTDQDEFYRESLRRRFAHHPGVTITELSLPMDLENRRFAEDEIDTVIALNVLEHIEDDIGALKSMRSILASQGKVVLVVPAMPALYGSLDKNLAHFRRYSRESMSAALQSAGFKVSHISYWNRIGALGWFTNAVLFRSEEISPLQLRLFDLLVPVLRHEHFCHFPFGQSLIVVGSKE